MLLWLQAQWANIRATATAYRRDFAVASAVFGAVFSAIAAYNSWSSAAASAAAARKAAAVQAAIAFEEKIHRYPAAGACMQAIIGSDNKAEVIDQLVKRESFIFKWANSKNNGRRVAYCVFGQEQPKAEDVDRAVRSHGESGRWYF
jgi:hypothetical protein